jgi:hypothetical protein
MVKNPEILEKFELELEQKINHTYEERLKIFESMFEFKKQLMKNEDPLEGLAEKIEIIKRLHSAKQVI